MCRASFYMRGVCFRFAISVQLFLVSCFDVQGGEDMEVLMPLVIDDKHRVECEALVSAQGDSVRLLWDEIRESFEDLVARETYESLAKRVSGEGRLGLEDLAAVGISGKLDLRSLTIFVEIPPSLLKTQVIPMSGRNVLDRFSSPVAPSELSGFLNFRMQVANQMGGGSRDGLQSPIFGLEQALQFRGWVLEQGARLDVRKNSALERRFSRVVRDVPEKRVRYSFGDIRSVARSFQDSVSLLGFTVERENRLQPFHQPRPRGQSDLFLDSESEVEIFVNGERVRSLHLAPGPYRMEDLHLGAGLTDVEMVVTDQWGVEKRIDLNFAFDQALLAPGEKDYYLGAGWKPGSTTLAGGYDWEQPVMSGFYRRGFSNVHTREWNFQGARDVVQGGVNSTWASSIGTFRCELGASGERSEGVGYALGLTYIKYSSRDRSDPSRGQWRFDLHHYSPQFRGIDGRSGQRAVVDLRMAHSRQLPWGMGSSFGAGYSRSSSETENSFYGTTSFSKRFSAGFSSRLNLSVRTDAVQGMMFGANLRFEWSFGRNRKHRLGTAFNSQSKTRELHYSYHPVTQLRAWRGSADLKQAAGGQWMADMRAGYASPRAELDLGQSMMEQDGGLSTRTSLQLGSSLAFAGGHWAVSRPINDAFVLVTGHDSLDGVDVKLNDQGQGEEASLNRWGTAVLANVQSYFPKSVRVEPAEDLPFAYDMGPANYSATMGYKSGSHIAIGSEPTVFVSGHVANRSGAPFALQVGEVVQLGKADWNPLTVFTTREGTFAIEGLRAGDYEIRWFDGNYSAVGFTIPEEAGETIDLGSLIVEEGSN